MHETAFPPNKDEEQQRRESEPDLGEEQVRQEPRMPAEDGKKRSQHRLLEGQVLSQKPECYDGIPDEHKAGRQPEPAPDHCRIARTKHELVNRHDHGEQWRVLNSIDRAGLVQQLVAPPFSDRRAEDEIHPSVPSEIDGSCMSWQPQQDGRTNHDSEPNQIRLSPRSPFGCGNSIVRESRRCRAARASTAATAAHGCEASATDSAGPTRRFGCRSTRSSRDASSSRAPSARFNSWMRIPCAWSSGRSQFKNARRMKSP